MFEKLESVNKQLAAKNDAYKRQVLTQIAAAKAKTIKVNPLTKLTVKQSKQRMSADCLLLS